MTRKDYELIAKALSKTGNREWRGEKALQTWVDTCSDITAALAEDNPRFDREKFLKACGVESE